MVSQAELARIVWFRPQPKLSLRVVNDVRGPSTTDVVDLGGEGLEAAKAAITAARRRRRGRRPGDAIEISFGGLPERDGNDAWQESRVRSWAVASLNWARRLLGSESVIVAAVLLRGGRSPSTRVLAVPIVDGELGWTRIRDRAVETFSAAFGIYSPTRYAALASAYLLEVGSAFDLGSVDLKALANAARDSRAKTFEAFERAAQDRFVEAIERTNELLEIARSAEADAAAAQARENALANATHYRDRMYALEDELASVKAHAEENKRRYREMKTTEDTLRTEHQNALTAAVRTAEARKQQDTVVALIRALKAHEQRAGRTFAPEFAAVLDACEDRRSLVPLYPPDDARDGAIEDEVFDGPATLGPRDGGVATGVDGAPGAPSPETAHGPGQDVGGAPVLGVAEPPPSRSSALAGVSTPDIADAYTGGASTDDSPDPYRPTFGVGEACVSLRTHGSRGTAPGADAVPADEGPGDDSAARRSDFATAVDSPRWASRQETAGAAREVVERARTDGRPDDALASSTVDTSPASYDMPARAEAHATRSDGADSRVGGDVVRGDIATHAVRAHRGASVVEPRSLVGLRSGAPESSLPASVAAADDALARPPADARWWRDSRETAHAMGVLVRGSEASRSVPKETDSAPVAHRDFEAERHAGPRSERVDAASPDAPNHSSSGAPPVPGWDDPPVVFARQSDADASAPPASGDAASGRPAVRPRRR